jgi:outer membrane murein-binding lipoprotein Lpp
MSRNRVYLVAAVTAGAALLSGCADYLNHYDTVTLEAGNAQKANMMLQTAEPFNPQSDNTAIDTDGVRASDAVIRYRNSQNAPQAQQNVTVNVGKL